MIYDYKNFLIIKKQDNATSNTIWDPRKGDPSPKVKTIYREM